jgi:hypothetical protein
MSAFDKVKNSIIHEWLKLRNPVVARAVTEKDVENLYKKSTQ